MLTLLSMCFLKLRLVEAENFRYIINSIVYRLKITQKTKTKQTKQNKLIVNLFHDKMILKYSGKNKRKCQSILLYIKCKY